MIKDFEELLDIEIDTKDIKRKAVVACTGDTRPLGDYRGIKSCRAASILSGGFKKCPYGCLGLGDCIKVCPQEAITIDKETDVAVITFNKCNGCGLCIKACPQEAITLVEKKKPVVLDQEKCIKCGACFDTCKLDSVIVK